MLNFVAPKSVMDTSKKASIEEQIPIARGQPNAGQYVIHKVQPNDTLDRLTIIYNVTKDLIRKAN